MCLVCALTIYLQQRPYEQHRCTRSTHQRGDAVAYNEHYAVCKWGRCRGVVNLDAARYDKERGKQNDERYVVVQYLFQERLSKIVPYQHNSRRYGYK